MKIKVETNSPIERTLSVEVPPERIQQELDRAYVSLGRRVKLRGFRQGHVPRAVLERNFRAEVEGEVVEKLVQGTFVEAVKTEQLDPVAPPHISLDGALTAGQVFKYSAKVEVKPVVVAKDYRGLSVTRRAVSVGDAEVDVELQKLQDSYATLVPVEGRQAAEEGDFAVIDHLGTVDGKPFEGGTAEGVTVKAAPGEIGAGFIPALVGRRIGEVVEIDEALPAEHRDLALRGKLAHMTVTLKGLKTRKLAALDDALAKQVGVEGIETLEALKARIREDLTKRETRRSEGELRDALLKAALARNEFEVPPSMVERTIDNMLEGTMERFARMGVDVRQLDLDVARLRADLREQALFQVRGALLLEAVADAEKLDPTDEDLEAELARVADEMGVPVQTAQKQMRGAEARAALRNKVREDKALSVLSTAATIQA